jgi:metal-responsive CopG/Arc/MetJ family transcriptional regulator
MTAKEKVTVSVDADLLKIIDSYVKETNDTSISRSSVFEQALHLWKQTMRDSFDEHYYASQAEALDKDNASWTRITTEAAKRIWQ